MARQSRYEDGMMAGLLAISTSGCTAGTMPAPPPAATQMIVTFTVALPALPAGATCRSSGGQAEPSAFVDDGYVRAAPAPASYAAQLGSVAQGRAPAAVPPPDGTKGLHTRIPADTAPQVINVPDPAQFLHLTAKQALVLSKSLASARQVLAMSALVFDQAIQRRSTEYHTVCDYKIEVHMAGGPGSKQVYIPGPGNFSGFAYNGAAQLAAIRTQQALYLDSDNVLLQAERGFVGGMQ